MLICIVPTPVFPIIFEEPSGRGVYIYIYTYILLYHDCLQNVHALTIRAMVIRIIGSSVLVIFRQ